MASWRRCVRGSIRWSSGPPSGRAGSLSELSLAEVGEPDGAQDDEGEEGQATGDDEQPEERRLCGVVHRVGGFLGVVDSGLEVAAGEGGRGLLQGALRIAPQKAEPLPQVARGLYLAASG